jgi:hypothetical protein
MIFSVSTITVLEQGTSLHQLDIAPKLQILDKAREVLDELLDRSEFVLGMAQEISEYLEGDAGLCKGFAWEIRHNIDPVVTGAEAALEFKDEILTDRDAADYEDPDDRNEKLELYERDLFVKIRMVSDHPSLSPEFRFRIQEIYTELLACTEHLKTIAHELIEYKDSSWTQEKKICHAVTLRASEKECRAFVRQCKLLSRSCAAEYKRLKAIVKSEQTSESLFSVGSLDASALPDLPSEFNS